MFELAKHIIAVAQDNNIEITRLQLQKVIYYAMRDYIKEHGLDDFIKELYDEAFIVQPYGAMLISVNDKYIVYGSLPITEENTQIKQFKVFNKYILNRLNQDVFKLVDQNQQEEIWLANRNKFNKEYKLKDLLN